MKRMTQCGHRRSDCTPMFVNFKQPLSKGEHGKETLIFERAGTVQIELMWETLWHLADLQVAASTEVCFRG